MKKFYVYEHWRPDLDLPFYVGKGSAARFDPNLTRNKHHSNIKNKLKKLGMCVEVRMVASGLSEDDALRLEIERIAFWKEHGIELSNKTAGGDGLKSPPEDVLEKMRAAAKKRWALPNSREKHSAATKAGMDNDAVRAKCSGGRVGKKHLLRRGQKCLHLNLVTPYQKKLEKKYQRLTLAIHTDQKPVASQDQRCLMTQRPK
jgi:hypothetical protein